MTILNLTQDRTAVQEMLADAVRRYVAQQAKPASREKRPPVTRIDFIFSLGDTVSTPWVHLHFDTKPAAEPDGNPTHPDFAKLSCPHWLPAVQAACDDETVAVVAHDGKRHKCQGDDLWMQVGQFLVTMLLEARDQGLFADLPKGARCELGVEDPTTGVFGWPQYEDRGKENVVV